VQSEVAENEKVEINGRLYSRILHYEKPSYLCRKDNIVITLVHIKSRIRNKINSGGGGGEGSRRPHEIKKYS
jgi:hypothetical protein